MLVHGTMDRASSFDKVARRLDDVEVLCFDRAGYGARAAEPPAARRIVDDAADLLERLHGQPAAVVGHSYGGHVAMAASLQRPDLVTAIGVYETPLAWMPWWPANTSGGAALAAAEKGSLADAAEVFMRSLLGDRLWERLPERSRESRRGEGPALVADLRSIRTTPDYDLADLQVPVVVGRGAAGAAHHRQGSEQLLEIVPRAELFVIAGAGHGAHTTHPDGFAGLVRRVLALAAS